MNQKWFVDQSDRNQCGIFGKRHSCVGIFCRQNCFCKFDHIPLCSRINQSHAFRLKCAFAWVSKSIQSFCVKIQCDIHPHLFECCESFEKTVEIFLVEPELCSGFHQQFIKMMKADSIVTESFHAGGIVSEFFVCHHATFIADVSPEKADRTVRLFFKNKFSIPDGQFSLCAGRRVTGKSGKIKSASAFDIIFEPERLPIRSLAKIQGFFRSGAENGKCEKNNE